MRQKRAKSYKKQINVYVHLFKFREPFQIIVDDEIVSLSEKSSFNLQKALQRTVQAEVKPMITQCCMQALYATKNQNAIDLGKSFERRRCNHPPSDPLTPVECIKSIVLPDNKFKYIIATQHVELRNRLRTVPGVPFLFLKNSVMVMDSISTATLKYAEALESKKLTGGLNDAQIGVQPEPMEEPPRKKKKGPKGPNPLSVKKKKEEKEDKGEEKEAEKKKRRKRKHSRRENGQDEKTQEAKSQDEGDKDENDDI